LKGTFKTKNKVKEIKFRSFLYIYIYKREGKENKRRLGIVYCRMECPAKHNGIHKKVSTNSNSKGIDSRGNFTCTHSHTNSLLHPIPNTTSLSPPHTLQAKLN